MPNKIRRKLLLCAASICTVMGAAYGYMASNVLHGAISGFVVFCVWATLIFSIKWGDE